MALLYGYNFQNRISTLLKEEDIDCIECRLGINIIGGVSFEDEDLIEFNFDVCRANQIVGELNNKLNNEEKYPLFDYKK
ncbi:MAG: hypothetical protein GF353_10250 [Candidatus Lokiarchaeota archaeon]|nr:hypothetical protein [Candidatus Lokiarchaeota archaeon]